MSCKGTRTNDGREPLLICDRRIMLSLLSAALTAALLIIFVVLLLLIRLVASALLLSLSRIVPVLIHVLSGVLFVRLG